ncbi:MAG TPA: acetylxylan esterase [Verrucomicrobiae bacterium]
MNARFTHLGASLHTNTQEAMASPSPPAERGEGRGEEGGVFIDLPSPLPSPYSSVEGRGSPHHSVLVPKCAPLFGVTCWPMLGLLMLGSFLVLSCPAAVSIAATDSPSQAMMNSFLKQEAIRLDATFLEGIANRQQWETRRAESRRDYLEMLGLWPWPERTPLQPVITGVIEREEGFRVEKLHFQSRPHLYVTGNLYLPKDAKPGAKLPAVLYVCGHSGRGRDGNKTAFQHHGMWFATHGYACLLIDTLQLGEIAAIHHGTYRYDRWWWQARGYTPAAVECWNGVRAIDYLQSRPEIDSDRIAVTGISGGGAATFWIAAADERVKVVVPVSGMSDLQDYVGEKVVNGHCDCMFCINTFQWPWTQIAALIAPRPLLFENSGHDTIFPMNGNDRIRARLERLYGFYTNRTDRLFDIGVTPGGHDDKPELRLMAYRWINRFLKGDDSPVTEPEFPKIEGKGLRAFPDELPADEINTKIDEMFVPLATSTPPSSAREFEAWRAAKLAELRRLAFRNLPEKFSAQAALKLNSRQMSSGTLPSEPGMTIPWIFHPPHNPKPGQATWLVVLGEDEPLAARPDWLNQAIGDVPVLLISPRNSGPTRWPDPAPFYIQRSLPLLGRTVDSCRLADVLAAAAHALQTKGSGAPKWKVIGRGAAGIIAAYAALFEPRLSEVVVVDPPASHRQGPIFLNVLRVLDVPEALGLLAPRPLTIYAAQSGAFESTASIYRVAGAQLKLQLLP